MKLKHYLLFFAALGLCVTPNDLKAIGNEKGSDISSVNQQGGITRVTGIIKDERGETLPGVTVVLKGTQYTGVSNIEGRYTVEFPNTTKNPILVFSFVGMKRIEVPANKSEISVVLEEETLLDEVVITGIFSRAKESYTGAARLMTRDELDNAGSKSLISTIKNIDPTFNITDNLAFGSDPNKLPSITMRGSSSLPTDVSGMQVDMESNSNQPLFILNGFQISLTRFMDLDEDQIESITLLKDASATAMYGSKGSKGVVVLTSKRPKSGKLSVRYAGTLDIAAPDLTTYNLMDAREKLAYEKAAGLYSSANANNQQGMDDLYNDRLADVVRGVETYWLKYPVRTGIGHRNSVTIEGGDKSLLYEAALSYRSVQSPMKGSARNTLNGRMQLIYSVKNLRFQNSLQVSSMKAKNSPYGNFEDYAKMNSYLKPYDDNGKIQKLVENQFYPLLYQKQEIINPLYNAFLPSIDDEEYLEVKNDFSIEWNILPELFLRGKFSVTTNKNTKDKFKSADHTDYRKYDEDGKSDRKGSYKYTSGKKDSYELQATANYQKVFNEAHDFFFGTGFTVEESQVETYIIDAEGLNAPGVNSLGMAQHYKKDSNPYGYDQITRNAGILMDASYTHDRRYFASANGKYEGSSKFGGNSRFAPFWSLGVGWNITNEKFFEQHKTFLNMAQIRASYGVTGSQPFNPYMSKLMFINSRGKGYQSQHGITIISMGNEDLKWEKTAKFNVGLTSLMFNNKLKLDVDVYKNVTSDLLVDINIPTAGGFNNYKSNIGEVHNTGVEIDATYHILRSNDRNHLSWNIGGTLRHNKNEIKKISNAIESMNDDILNDGDNNMLNPSLLIREGYSQNTIYAVRSKGIDPATGKEIFIKADGTATFEYDPRDQVACGNTDDKIMGTINTSLRYKGFTFTAYMAYRYGAYAYNTTLANKVENINPNTNADVRAYYDRWKEPGDIAKFKSVLDLTSTKATERFVMKNNVFNCSSITLLYELPREWSKTHLYSNYVTVKGAVEDIFYFSTIKRERGTSTPFARNISFTLSAKF